MQRNADAPVYTSNMLPVTGAVTTEQGMKFLIVSEGKFAFHGSQSWTNLKQIESVQTRPNADWLWLSSCDVPRHYAPDGTVFQFKTKKDLRLLMIDDEKTNQIVQDLLGVIERISFSYLFDPKDRTSSRSGDLLTSQDIISTLKDERRINCDGYVSRNWPSDRHDLFHLEMAVHNWSQKLEPVRALKFENPNVDPSSSSAKLIVKETRLKDDKVKSIDCHFRHHSRVNMGKGGGRAARIRVAIPIVALLGALAAVAPRP